MTSSKGKNSGPFEIEWIDQQRGFLVRDDRRFPFVVAVEGTGVWVRWAGRAYFLARQTSGDTSRDESGTKTTETRAPMPGVVLSVNVKAGDEVSEGTLLLTLEAMKMEHEIRATAAVRVTQLMVKEGERVDAGAQLLDLRPLDHEM